MSPVLKSVFFLSASNVSGCRWMPTVRSCNKRLCRATRLPLTLFIVRKNPLIAIFAHGPRSTCTFGSDTSTQREATKIVVTFENCTGISPVTVFCCYRVILPGWLSWLIKSLVGPRPPPPPPLRSPVELADTITDSSSPVHLDDAPDSGVTGKGFIVFRPRCLLQQEY